MGIIVVGCHRTARAGNRGVPVRAGHTDGGASCSSHHCAGQAHCCPGDITVGRRLAFTRAQARRLASRISRRESLGSGQSGCCRGAQARCAASANG
jgi:hypothetical protein